MPKRPYEGRVGQKVKRRRRHLYVVMKDEDGRCGIHKFDLWTNLLDDGHPVVEGLPPALTHFDSPSRGFFAAIGTKIMVFHSKSDKIGVPFFDVSTHNMGRGPRTRSGLSQPIYLPVGDKLVALDDDSSELLYPPPQEGKWSPCKLPNLSFKLQDITSHAVHPDGRTIFVSVKSNSSTVTFSLDTESDDARWRFHGMWGLPFTGRAHFVPGLDAWVGLSGDQDTLGHLCSCDVVSTDPDSSNWHSPPPWKLGKEKLFCKKSFEEHVGANLLYLGVETNFCLLHYFNVKDDDCMPHLLRLLTFSVKYDKNGDIWTCRNLESSVNGARWTKSRRRSRCYQLPTSFLWHSGCNKNHRCLGCSIIHCYVKLSVG